jgi:hypothetical protein
MSDFIQKNKAVVIVAMILLACLLCCCMIMLFGLVSGDTATNSSSDNNQEETQEGEESNSDNQESASESLEEGDQDSKSEIQSNVNDEIEFRVDEYIEEAGRTENTDESIRIDAYAVVELSEEDVLEIYQYYLDGLSDKYTDRIIVTIYESKEVYNRVENFGYSDTSEENLSKLEEPIAELTVRGDNYLYATFKTEDISEELK